MDLTDQDKKNLLETLTVTFPKQRLCCDRHFPAPIFLVSLLPKRMVNGFNVYHFEYNE